MARHTSTLPTDGELQVLAVLWEAPEQQARLGEIHRVINERRKTALTTVANTLLVMKWKKLVKRKKQEGRPYWKPIMTQKEYQEKAIQRLEAITGSRRQMLQIMFDRSSEEELREISGMLQEKLSHSERGSIA